MGSRAIGNLAAKVTADTAGFVAGMDRVKKSAAEATEEVMARTRMIRQAAFDGQLSAAKDRHKAAVAAAVAASAAADEKLNLFPMLRKQELAHDRSDAALRRQLQTMIPLARSAGIVGLYATGIAVSLSSAVRGAMAMRDALDGAGQAAKLINQFGDDYAENAKLTADRLSAIENARMGIFADYGFERVLKEAGKAWHDLLAPPESRFSTALEQERKALEGTFRIQSKLANKERERLRVREGLLANDDANDAYLDTLNERERAEKGFQFRKARIEREMLTESNARVRQAVLWQVAFMEIAHKKAMDALRRSIEDGVGGLRARNIRGQSQLTDSRGKAAMFELRASHIETHIEVARLRRELDRETDSEARRLIQERIDLELEGLDQIRRRIQKDSEDRRRALKFDLVSDQAKTIRGEASLELDPRKAAALELKAIQLESAAEVAKLRRELDLETDAEARRLIKERIDLERKGLDQRRKGVARDLANQMFDRMQAQGLPPLLIAGTAEAQAFRHDQSRNPAEEIQLELLRSSERLLERIERNTAGQGVSVSILF